MVSYKIYGTEAGVGTATSEGEPAGYKITLTVDDTPVPVYIGDRKLLPDEYADFSAQKIYRCYNELVLTGTEDNLYFYGMFEGAIAFYLDLPANEKSVTGTPYLSSNYYTTVYVDKPSTDKTCRYRYYGSTGKWSLGRIYIFDNDYTSLADYKEHLVELYNAGTPLKITYLLKDAPVPTDPPAALPAITASGETTITTSEILGDIELTGNWQALMGSTEGESIDIGFTVDAEEYIAFVTVDDDPSIQVTDTITMPSSADSFTLQVVAWGREQYTETVYNALS